MTTPPRVAGISAKEVVHELTCAETREGRDDWYLTLFDDSSMDHIPDEDLSAVDEAAHKVVREAKAAGVWIFGGGVQRQQSTIVATDGSIRFGPVPETKAVIGGFCIIEVASREEALVWATRIAGACRCAQEVREIMFDPES